MKKNISALFGLIIILFSFFSPFLVFAAPTDPTIELEFVSELNLFKPGTTDIKNVLWKININTTNVPNNTIVNIHRLKNGTEEGSTVKLKIFSNQAKYNSDYILETATNYEIKALIMLPNNVNIIGTYSKTTEGTKPITKEEFTSLTNKIVTGGTFSYFKVGLTGNQNTIITDKNKTSKFDTLIACNISRSQYLIDNKASVITECIPSNTSFETTAQVVTPVVIPVSITPKKDTTLKDDVYNLLAPIGEFKQAPKNIGDYFNTIFTIAIGLCAALAVIMIVIGGIQYMGEDSIFSKTEAKSKITSAIFGLLIALGSYALLNTINPDLLGKNGVNIKAVSASIETETVPWSTYETGDNKDLCPKGFIDITSTNDKTKKLNVCNSIADKLVFMINAAKKDGIVLWGYGSRKVSTTQKLRVQNNCSDPKLPSSACHPDAVAQPGNSNHEKGLAVDFTCNGTSMHPDKLNKNNVCYVWLAKNAKIYGFYNSFDLIKETWHWSTTGT